MIPNANGNHCFTISLVLLLVKQCALTNDRYVFFKDLFIQRQSKMSRLQVLSVPHLDLTSQMTSLPAKGHEYRKRSAAYLLKKM